MLFIWHGHFIKVETSLGTTHRQKPPPTVPPNNVHLPLSHHPFLHFSKSRINKVPSKCPDATIPEYVLLHIPQLICDKVKLIDILP